MCKALQGAGACKGCRQGGCEGAALMLWYCWYSAVWHLAAALQVVCMSCL